MERDDLIDLFSEFGPVVLRRMFGGYGIVADGVNFAMALRDGIIFRVDDLTSPRYDAEGAKPFQYTTRKKTVVVRSYRHLPERLYDDPEELAVWAREAVGAAKRAALKKLAAKKRARLPKGTAKKPAPVNAKAAKAKRVALKPVARRGAKAVMPSRPVRKTTAKRQAT